MTNEERIERLELAVIVLGSVLILNAEDPETISFIKDAVPMLDTLGEEQFDKWRKRNARATEG